MLLQIASVGVAVDLQEQLEAGGHQVRWDGEGQVTPAHTDIYDLIIVAAETATPGGIEAWLDREPPPAIAVLGVPGADVAALGVEVIAHVASERTVPEAVARALARRFVSRMSAGFARAALSLPAELEGDELAASVVRAGRAAPADMVRAALKPHASCYVATTEVVDRLRAARVFEIPEVGLLARCDGATTLQAVAAAEGIEPLAIARLLWSLASVGGITLTAEPPDRSTRARRRLAEVRQHLQRRYERIGRASPYDVLEVHRDTYLDEIDAACQALGGVFAPEQVADLDLGTLSQLPAMLWKQILEARSVLYYEHTHIQIDAIIDHRPGTYDPCVFGSAAIDHRAAKKIFNQGQQALAGGDVFKAVSLMARAARMHPEHPVYAAYLHWARYRAEVERGGDKAAAARREREIAETFIYGRRPRAQALVALALLCVADGDPDSARWHVMHASRLDPELAAARRLLARLS